MRISQIQNIGLTHSNNYVLNIKLPWRIENNRNYGNTESQRINSYIYMPLFNPIYIGLYAGTFEQTQLYSNGTRRKYETLDEFGLIISYQI